MVDILLESPALFSPSTITNSVASTKILPASPSSIPSVSVVIRPPFVTSNIFVSIRIFPAFPSAPFVPGSIILLAIELESPSLFSPSTITNSVSAIVISPASATAPSSTLLVIKPPFVTSSEPVVILISPAFNPAGDDISLDILLEFRSLFSPSTTTDSFAAIVIFPPSPIPSLLLEIKPPFVSSNEPVVIVISPAFSSNVCENCENKMLDILLDSRLLFSPSTTIDSVAAIVISPPYAVPKVSAEIKAPFVSSNEPVVISRLPAFPRLPGFPSASSNTMLDILLDSRSLFSPSTTIDSFATIVISPPSPIPSVSLTIRPPFVTLNEPVVISRLPGFPSAFSSIILAILLSSKETVPNTSIIISPPTVSESPKPVEIPANIRLRSVKFKF